MGYPGALKIESLMKSVPISVKLTYSFSETTINNQNAKMKGVNFVKTYLYPYPGGWGENRAIFMAKQYSLLGGLSQEFSPGKTSRKNPLKSVSFYKTFP